MKTGTIKSTEPNGIWNGLTKYKVTFKDGLQYTFFSKGEFKFKVGDKLTYEVTNEEYKNARIPKDQYGKKDTSKKDLPINEAVEVKKDLSLKNNYRIKETCITASASFNAQRLSDVDKVINDAQLMFNFITQ